MSRRQGWIKRCLGLPPLFSWPRAAHWLAPLLAECLPRALARLFDRLPAGLLGGDARREAWRPLLAPAFFLLMLPGCYACLAAAGLPTQRARELGWLFERPAGGAGGGFAQVWQLLDFSRVDWGAPKAARGGVGAALSPRVGSS